MLLYQVTHVRLNQDINWLAQLLVSGGLGNPRGCVVWRKVLWFALSVPMCCEGSGGDLDIAGLHALGALCPRLRSPSST